MADPQRPERYVILRAHPRLPHDLIRAGEPAPGMMMEHPSPSGPPVEMSIDVDEIKPRSVAKLVKSADVAAVAPILPMKLIGEVEKAESPAPQPSTIAWGITEVLADKSQLRGHGVVVAVVDTGIDRTHPAFDGVNVVEEDFSGTGNGDTNGHGTHCAGTIFGQPVNGVRFGIALGIRQALIGKVIGDTNGSTDRVIRAIEWAVNKGAHIVTLSLGFDVLTHMQKLKNDGIPDAAAMSQTVEAYRANVSMFERLAALIRAQAPSRQPTILVAAAGNESNRVAIPPVTIGVSPPAVAEGVISVAAVEKGIAGLRVAHFSNTGANVAAPGVGILSAGLNHTLAIQSGTSMAAPHVAGVAALWAERIMNTGSLTGLGLTSRLVASATTKPFRPGFEPADIGEGIVTAPLE